MVLVDVEPYIKGMMVTTLIAILEEIRDKHGPDTWIGNSPVQNLTVWGGVRPDHAFGQRGYAAFDAEATLVGAVDLSAEHFDDFS